MNSLGLNFCSQNVFAAHTGTQQLTNFGNHQIKFKRAAFSPVFPFQIYYLLASNNFFVEIKEKNYYNGRRESEIKLQPKRIPSFCVRG